MRKKANTILFIAFLWFFAAGCGVDDKVYFKQAASDGTECEQTSVTEMIPEEKDTDVAGTDEETETLPDTCYVYICGAVLSPGVYEVPQGCRIYEVVQMAGGLTVDASQSFVNQAEQVYDGQMIFLPTVEEAEAGVDVDAVSYAVEGAGTLEMEKEQTDGRVNINTATLSELMTLSGIGQTKAERILEYRGEHGSFSSVEEIMNVDGIKEGLYNRIKDDVRVN